MSQRLLRSLPIPILAVLVICACASVTTATTVVIPTDLNMIIGDRESLVFGTPQFDPLEHVLVYLDTWPDGSLRVHEMLLGKFSIKRDAVTGRLFAVRNTQGAHVEVLPNPGAGSSDGLGSAIGEQITSRMELSAYTAMVRQKLKENQDRAHEFESRYYAGVPLLAEPPEYGDKLRTGGLTPQFHLF